MKLSQVLLLAISAGQACGQLYVGIYFDGNESLLQTELCSGFRTKHEEIIAEGAKTAGDYIDMVGVPQYAELTAEEPVAYNNDIMLRGADYGNRNLAQRRLGVCETYNCHKPQNYAFCCLVGCNAACSAQGSGGRRDLLAIDGANQDFELVKHFPDIVTRVTEGIEAEAAKTPVEKRQCLGTNAVGVFEGTVQVFDIFAGP